MNLKELIKEVERLKDNYELAVKNNCGMTIEALPDILQGIKQTVEALDYLITEYLEDIEDYYKLKKLLGVK